jgi:uncharacterized membrane protein YkvA (DUF1232 family)
MVPSAHPTPSPDAQGNLGKDRVMDLKDFMQSKWVRVAQDPQTVWRVLEELPIWIERVRDSELVNRARRLRNYLTSGRCSVADIALVVGALLYLISPIDAIPDFIPVAGWLDDIAVAGLVLGYLDKKAADCEPPQVSS